MKANRLSGHILSNEGRIYEKDHRGWYGARVKVGPVTCSCWARSPVLGSDAARRQWHREHKAAVREERSA